MKKYFSIVLIVILCVACFIAPTKKVFALENGGVISVIGESTIKLSPDMATITATINQSDMELEVAKEKVFETYNSVKNILQQNEHFSQLNMLYFSTYPNFDYSSGRTLTGYNASLSFEFEVDEINQIQSAVDSLIECGVKKISSINYQVKDYVNEYNNLLQSAVENATTKAKLILNKDNVVIKNIVEQETYNSCYMCRSYVENDSASAFDSQIEILAKVVVEFEWLKKQDIKSCFFVIQ